MATVVAAGRSFCGRHLRVASAAFVVACLSAGAVLAPSNALPASAASPSVPILFGAAAPGYRVVQDNERVLGTTLRGLRIYKKWDDNLFGNTEVTERNTGHTLFMSINAQRRDGSKALWNDIARAQPGSGAYVAMQTQAQQIKAFGATVYIAFHHEPDATVNRSFGGSADFVAAWRTWVATLQAAGVRNVRFVWTVTAYGLVRNDAGRASAFYPGDAYVDDIAADGYNWYRCRTTSGPWLEAADIFEGQRQFGLQHPAKGLMIWEFNSSEDRATPGRKAQWYGNATQLFQQPKYSQYKAVLTWEGRAFNGSGPDCQFDYLSSASATQAWRAMGTNPAFRATTP